MGSGAVAWAFEDYTKVDAVLGALVLLGFGGGDSAELMRWATLSAVGAADVE